jgi:peptide-methionine (S)-S-oxide reductase
MNEVAIFGGGCFWCTEAVFTQLRGVEHVASGYAGGNTENPTYWDLHEEDTGHAEVIKVEFNPDEITYKDLLTVFFASHDPTQVNRQGHDVGTEYRSLILTTSDKQKAEVAEYINKLKTEDGLNVATEVQPLIKFFPAESYHQNYYENNKSAPYCQIIIEPKLQKLQTKFADLLKTQSK